MFQNFSFNSILVLVIGLLLLIAGGYYAVNSRMYNLTAGLIFAGTGSVLCGLTNGFSDYTPRGRLIRKIGAIAFIIGLPLVFYSLFRFI